MACLGMVRRPRDGFAEVGPGRIKVKRPAISGARGKIALMSFRRLRQGLSRLAPLGALLLVLGCTQKITVCPVPAILADTQSVTFFKPGTAPDLANELFTVSLTNAQGDCTYDTHSALVKSSIDLTFRATRAPTN